MGVNRLSKAPPWNTNLAVLVPLTDADRVVSLLTEARDRVKGRLEFHEGEIAKCEQNIGDYDAAWNGTDDAEQRYAITDKRDTEMEYLSEMAEARDGDELDLAALNAVLKQLEAGRGR